jgi:hypothetical protein
LSHLGAAGNLLAWPGRILIRDQIRCRWSMPSLMNSRFEPAAAALLIIDMQRDFPRARRVRRVARQRCEPAAP